MTADDLARAALLAAVIADPADDLPRLAMADFCEEHGDSARSEFIRAQCAHPEWFDALPGPPDPLPEDVARAWNVLHDGVADAWLAGLPGAPFGPGRPGTPCWERASRGGEVLVRFRRGFVAEISFPCDAWPAHGQTLARAAPLERVTLSGKEPWRPTWAHGGHEHWWWVCANRNNANRPEALPRPLFRALARLRRWDRRTGTGLGFADRDVALAALSGAALAWAAAVAEGKPCV